MKIDPFTKDEKLFFIVSLGSFFLGLFILSSSATFTASTLPAEMTDVFAGQYQNSAESNTLLPDPATLTVPVMPDVELEGLEATPTPSLLPSQTTITLLYPDAGAVLTNTRQNRRGYPLKLRFEVNPKKAVVVLELKKNGVVMLKRTFQNSATGQYLVKLLVRSEGHYQWSVMSNDPKTNGIASRYFTIRGPASPQPAVSPAKEPAPTLPPPELLNN